MDRPAEFLGADQQREFSGYGPVFSPKAPPTSSVRTRTLSFGRLMMAMIVSRMAPAPCEQVRVR